MTTVDGMPISSELAEFLKNYCPEKTGEGTFLTAGIETISGMQDFLCLQLAEMEEDEKAEASSYLSDIVMLKKDLIKFAKLLPVIETTKGGYV